VHFVRRRPFLTLALITLAVGAVWHLSGLNAEEGPLGSAMFAIAYVLGMPFILAMRLVGSVVTHPALRGVLGFVLGMLPYLAADEVVRRRRLRKQRFVARQG
jgi:hypothetical protein